MNTMKGSLVGAMALAIAACGDDGGGSGTGGGGSGSGGAAATSTGAMSSGAATGPTTGSTTSASTGAGGMDECSGACGSGTSCQLCADTLFPEDAEYECATLDPEPTPQQFRCGEDNCARSDEVCIVGDYVFEEIVCGEPERCRAIDEACDDCACAVERINSTFCVGECTDDGAGAVFIAGTDLQGSDCLNCTDPGDPCTEDFECCALDGLDAFCNAGGECEVDEEGGGK